MSTETNAPRYILQVPSSVGRILWILAALMLALVFSCGLAVSSMYYTNRHLDRVEDQVNGWQQKVDEQNAILVREGLKVPDFAEDPSVEQRPRLPPLHP